MNRRAALLTVLANQDAYYQRVVSLVGQSSIVAYYPMWEPSGNTITDIINARNGTIANGTRGVAGVGDGKTATSFSGTGYGNIDALAAGWNWPAMTVMIWVKVAEAANYSDGYHTLIRNLVDSDNFFTLSLDGGTANRVYMGLEMGNTNTSPSLTSVANTGWWNFGGVWDKPNSFAYMLYNGARHTPYTVIGEGTGTPGTNAIVSNAEGSASVAWKGSVAHVLYINRALTEAESCAVVDMAGVGVKTIALLGDSIIGFATGAFQNAVLGAYNGGNARVRNHGATGSTVLTHMAGQVTAAASDNANMVIIELGVNDNNAGNMTTLQATAEANIATLKANHPSASIYWMNVLPIWTNNTTGPAVDKAAIRTAIAAACTAQGITCWDTFTDPWIAQNQTADGIHPTAAGHAAIAARIKTLLGLA